MIHEDIIGETFYYLSKKSADEIIEMHESNPKRLIGLCTTIAVLKGVAKSSTNPDYPKHSIATTILHTSTLQQLSVVSQTEESDDESKHNDIILADKSSIFSNEQLMWEMIMDNLSNEENELLELMLSDTTKKKEYDINEKKLLSRIRKIIINKGLRVKPCLSRNKRKK